jgi:prepilin-type processing-associated H-X9-DG protein
MSKKPNLTNYVSSGQFAADIKRLYPKGPFSPKSAQSADDLAQLAEVLSAPVKKELLALGDLARGGKLPQLGRENKPVGLQTTFTVGYSIADDFGDDLEDTFEDTGTPYELARKAIGLATNGGGVMHFLLADGHVAALDMGAYNEWQWRRFSSLGEYLWVVFHGRAAAAGRTSEVEYKATVSALDCADTARTFDVPEAVLPPLSKRHPKKAPVWLQ